MPELPEVETIRRTLEPVLVGARVSRLEVRSPHCWQGPREAVAGRRIEDLGRRGKYLVARFDGGWTLIMHLRMTGRLVHLAPGRRWRLPSRHTHAVLHLEGRGRVVFYDVRKFGRLLAVPDAEVPACLPSGRDPLLDGLDGGHLERLLAGRRGPVKPLLLRQDLVAGLGNIYADESLWRARIHPRRPGGALDTAELRGLAVAIDAVLAEAVAFRGTTLLDYRDGSGRPGAFASRLAVYGRAGEPCPHCGATVERCTLAGRSSHFCPVCQPAEGTRRRRRRPAAEDRERRAPTGAPAAGGGSDGAAAQSGAPAAGGGSDGAAAQPGAAAAGGRRRHAARARGGVVAW